MKHEGTPPEMKSVNYYRNNYINSLFNRMMSERINELVQKGEPPFISGGVSYGGFARGYNILSISANAHPNRMDEGLRAIYTEAQRVLASRVYRIRTGKGKKHYPHPDRNPLETTGQNT
jgi:zinc protease